VEWPELLVRKWFTARPGAGTVELRIGSDADVYPNGKQLGLDIPAPTEDLRGSANEDRYRRGGKPHDVHPREQLVAFAEPPGGGALATGAEPLERVERERELELQVCPAGRRHRRFERVRRRADIVQLRQRDAGDVVQQRLER